MLYPVTLTPSSVETGGDTAYASCVHYIFGEVERNGVLFNFCDGRLAERISEHLGTNTAEAAKLRTAWRRLKDLNRILRVRCRHQHESTPNEWVAEALALDSPEPLFAIFARRDELSDVTDTRAMAVDAAPLSDVFATRRTDRHVPRNITQVLPPLAQLVRFSRKVWLIDYVIYKHLTENRAEKIAPAVIELLRAWGVAAGAPRAEFKLVTENPGNHGLRALTTWAEPLKRAIATSLPNDVGSVSAVFYSAPHREFHRNRFLLTELACVQVGKGFDIPRGNAIGKEVLSLMSERTAREIEAAFDFWRPLEVPLR